MNRDPTTGLKLKPSIRPFKGFNAVEDCETLRKALHGFGTDEDSIISVLGNRTYDQRKEIASEYISTFGKSLIEDLKSEIGDEFEKIVVNLFKSPMLQLATSCHEAIKGAGTDERLLVEALCVCSNEEIKEIKRLYKSEFDSELSDDIEGDMSGLVQRCLIALLQCMRDEITKEALDKFDKSGENTRLVDYQVVEQDCEELYNAGEGKLGTDEEVFLKIFCKRNPFQIKAIDKMYQEKHGIPLTEAIENELGGEIGHAVGLMVKANTDRCGLFAEIIHDAVTGLGTDDDVLIRIIPARCDIDLESIKERYAQKYGESLYDRINSETGGDYKRILLEIIKP